MAARCLAIKKCEKGVILFASRLYHFFEIFLLTCPTGGCRADSFGDLGAAMIKSGTRISDKYDIYFNVFTEMSEEEASKLIEEHKYHLTFDSIVDASNNLILPSGRTFTDNPNIYKTSFDECVNVSPGAFLLKGVKFSE